MRNVNLFGKFLAIIALAFTVLFSSVAWKNQDEEQEQEPYSIWANFIASGWMGDGELGEKYIQLYEAWEDTTRPDSLCMKIVYTPGPNGWAGIYWQNEPDNWGDLPGKDMSKSGFTKITFWAKGEKGKEVVEFKAGDIKATGKKHKDSFSATIGKEILKKSWQKYTIDLAGKDLSSVIGGFCWVASKSGNPKGLTFYIDDMQFE